MSPVPIVINSLLFSVAWIFCVLSGASNRPLIGLVSVAVVVAIHLLRARSFLPELLLVLLSAWFGALWDGMLAGLGWVHYSSQQFHAWLPPLWVIGTWALVATLLNVSLRRLKGRVALAGGLGMVVGLIGSAIMQTLGAVSFPDPLIAFPAIAVGWFFAGPFLVWLTMRLDGFGIRGGV